MKTVDEIRAEIKRLKCELEDARRRGWRDLVTPPAKIEALTWALGETDEPTVRVKIK